MCCGGYVPYLDVVPGEVILLSSGEGRPKAGGGGRVVIVWIKDGGSALCVDGTTISCFSEFAKTGAFIAPEKLSGLVSDKAKRKKERADFRERKNLKDFGLSEDEIEQFFAQKYKDDFDQGAIPDSVEDVIDGDEPEIPEDGYQSSPE